MVKRVRFRPGIVRSMCSSAWRGRWRLMALAAVLALACGQNRPSVAEWRDVWSGRPTVPDAAQLTGSDAPSLCDRLLVEVREARERLLPTPDRELDRTVEQWIERAESLGFDCPGRKGRAELATTDREELRILAAEVDAALATLSEPKR